MPAAASLLLWVLAVALHVRSPAADAPLPSPAVCPKGYFRNVTALFPCDTSKGTAYAPVSVSEAVTVQVPVGVTDLQLRIVAPMAMSLTVQDGLHELGTVEDGKQSVSWQGVTLELNAAKSVSAAGANLLMGEWHADVSFQGTSPGRLQVAAQGTIDEGQQLATIMYQYSSYSGCSKPSLATGCDDFNRYGSRQLVFNWSSWVQSKYSSADAAWSALCVDAMANIPSLGAGPVPLYMFRQVWTPWPEAGSMKLSWREAFRFMDTLGGTPPNGYVEKSEFETAYSLSSIFLSMFSWCESLQEKYKTSVDAWAALSGGDRSTPADYNTWKNKIWSSYEPSGGMQKASADQSFVYADANGDEHVTEKEFASIYFSCDPSSQGATPGGGASEAEEKEQAAIENASASRAQLVGPSTTEALPAGWNSGAAASFIAATTTTSVMPAASLPKCLYNGVVFEGGRLGSSASVTNATSCQANCRQTPGCGRFTYSLGGSCTLHGPSAKWRHSQDFISGPARCMVVVTQRVLGAGDIQVVTPSLADPTQLSSLQRRLGLDLGEAAGLPANRVQDLTGQLGRISLLPEAKGILLRGILDLPPGGVLADVTGVVSSKEAYARTLSTLAQQNLVPPSVTLSEVEFMTSVAADALAQCFVAGTKYEPNLMVEAPYSQNSTTCQAKCAQTNGCAYFTFFKTTGVCTLQGGAATPAAASGALAGPAVCSALPADASEPDKATLEEEAGQGSIFQSAWFWILLVLLVALGIAAFLQRKQIARFSSRAIGSSRFKYCTSCCGLCGSNGSSNSGGKTANNGAKYRYTPLAAEQSSEEFMQHMQQPAADPAPNGHGGDNIRLAPPRPARRLPPAPAAGSQSSSSVGSGPGVSSHYNSGNAEFGNSCSSFQQLQPRTPAPSEGRPGWMPNFLGPNDAKALGAELSRSHGGSMHLSDGAASMMQPSLQELQQQLLQTQQKMQHAQTMQVHPQMGQAMPQAHSWSSSLQDGYYAQPGQMGWPMMQSSMPGSASPYSYVT
eukprot:TRINITY_DN10837_c0_g1_i1.p1 TRINITY_DN10837_c0_g1~~TRINITY_DN10837_c0_g1_i1.p1  ORF type:complete len:1016 (-),score=189.90 TRINITY_DN10837_c0_g1_i1:31-3078(-)